MKHMKFKKDCDMPVSVFMEFSSAPAVDDHDEKSSNNQPNNEEIKVFILNDLLTTESDSVSFAVRCRKKGTILDLKKTFCKNHRKSFKIPIKPESICLVRDDKPLEDEQTIEYLGIDYSAFIHLLVYNDKVSIKLTLSTMENKDDIKQNLDEMDVKNNDNNNNNSEDSKSNENKKNKKFKFKKNNKNNKNKSNSASKPKIIEVYGNYTLEAVKVKICQAIKSKYKPGDIKIRHNGRIVSDKKTVCALGLQNGDKLLQVLALDGGKDIRLSRKSEWSHTVKMAHQAVLYNANGADMKLFVQTLTKKKISIYLLSTDKITRVKNKVEDKLGIPPEQQQLVYKGEKLDDKLCINDYNIQTEETLILALRLRGGDDSQQNNVCVVTFKNGKHDLKEYKAEDYTGECDTYGDFKKYWCEEANNLNVKDLRVVVNGEDVTDSIKDDNTPLEDIDFIQNASKIYIENKNNESYAIKNFQLLLIPGDEYLVSPDQVDHGVQKLIINKYWPISQVKAAYASMIPNAHVETLHLIYDGIYLHNEYTINSYNIKQNDTKNPIVSISSKKGGFSLKFMSWLRTSRDKNANENKKNLSDIKELWDSVAKTKGNNDELLTVAVQRGSKKIKELKNDELKSLPESALMAIYLWTEDFLYHRVNSALEHGSDQNLEQELHDWKPFLKTLDYGLRSLPYLLNEPVYRGINGLKDLSGYKKGEVFCWKRVSAFSKDKELSLGFCMAGEEQRLLFEVNSIDGRYIAHVSKYEEEEEVLFLPHSYFKVLEDPKSMKIKETGDEYFYIKLQQVQMPRSPKIVVWVDDNPQNNQEWISKLEKQAISVVTCLTTADAISIMDAYKWILMLRGTAIRIVTDMHRDEYGISKPIAGIELIKQLRDYHGFHNDILIFTGREKITRKHCQTHKATRNVFVTTEGDVLEDFVSHKQIDKKRYGFDQ